VKGLALAAALAIGLSAGVTQAALPVLDEDAALEASRAAIGNRIGDHAFRDTARREVTLAQFEGKPLLINLIYTSCTTACPLTVENLYRAVEVAQETFGEDAFAVATIGFDTRQDTPARMQAFARERGVDLPNWTFLSADRDTIRALAAELGFAIYPSATALDHLAQTSVIDGEGRVYRQIYGAGFTVPAVVEPLKQLVFGTRSDWTSLDGLANRVRLFCTVYDPKSDRYRFDFSPFIGLAIGLMALSLVGGVFVREWRRVRRVQAAPEGAPPRP
jgi:protein SCO1